MLFAEEIFRATGADIIASAPTIARTIIVWSL